jgi:1-acyl-sn-glycerol-3-phosphate acyltransferase
MFKHLLYDLLRLYVRAGLRFYFNRIEIRGENQIPDDVPLFFTANHQNSFLDAILIAVTQPRHLHFLVRSDVFKNEITRKILSALNMMPVYRIRDGWSSIQNNHETFSTTAQLLVAHSSVLIFPEGNHSLLRRLRPLSRGFTKPIAQALEINPGLPIHVVPVGLNFSAHLNFRSSVSVIYGTPIPVKEFYMEGQLDANRLRETVAGEMKKLITHIEDHDRYDDVIRKIQTHTPDYLNPEAVNKLIYAAESASEKSVVRKAGTFQHISRFMHFLPLIGWKAVREKIKDPVFTGSIKFVYGIFIFPIYYLLLFLCLSFLLPWYYALLIVLLFIFCSRHMSVNQ